jgi:aspartate aminotransferase-like enzyme
LSRENFSLHKLHAFDERCGAQCDNDEDEFPEPVDPEENDEIVDKVDDLELLTSSHVEVPKSDTELFERSDGILLYP